MNKELWDEMIDYCHHCQFYDFGRTAPTAYGAFCNRFETTLKEGMKFCNQLNEYERRLLD